MTSLKSGRLLESLLDSSRQYCLIFWLGGVGILVWEYGLTTCINKVSGLKLGESAFFIFWIAFVIIASANFVEKLSIYILRFLEGYYFPYWVECMVLKFKNKCYFKPIEEKFNKLAANVADMPQALSPRERKKYIKIDKILRYLPDEEERLPTKVGNILRTAELHSNLRYGLNAFVCFSRLWLLLPKDVKKQIEKSSKMLETSACSWLWSLLFMLWGFLRWEALLVSLILLIMSYQSVLQAAEQYTQFIESSFDLYRHFLYQSLRWRMPTDLESEKIEGKEITEFLWRGFLKNGKTFTETFSPATSPPRGTEDRSEEPELDTCC